MVVEVVVLVVVVVVVVVEEVVGGVKDGFSDKVMVPSVSPRGFLALQA